MPRISPPPQFPTTPPRPGMQFEPGVGWIDPPEPPPAGNGFFVKADPKIAETVDRIMATATASAVDAGRISHSDGDEWFGQIREQMIAAGIEPPSNFITDGRIHRFGDKDTGWYVVHLDRIAPVWHFGDWRTAIKESGEGNPGRALTDEEVAERRKRLREQRIRIEAEEERFRAEAAIEAQQRWDAATPAPANHAYLRDKRIAPFGTRIEHGKLLVAMRDVDGKIWSLQEIHPSGDKRNQKNGFRRGCFFQIGEPGETFCIGEGFATCATLRKATDYAVFCAGDAGNLESVARALRKKYPGAEIIVCGDDDWLTKVKGKPHNTGKLAAKRAAEAVNGVLALPWFSESARPKDATDFNDMARLHGLDEVRTAIRLARIAHEEEQERRKAADIEVNLEHPNTPGVEPEPPPSEGGAGAAGDHMDVPGADSAGPAKGS